MKTLFIILVAAIAPLSIYIAFDKRPYSYTGKSKISPDGEYSAVLLSRFELCELIPWGPPKPGIILLKRKDGDIMGRYNVNDVEAIDTVQWQKDRVYMKFCGPEGESEDFMLPDKINLKPFKQVCSPHGKYMAIADPYQPNSTEGYISIVRIGGFPIAEFTVSDLESIDKIKWTENSVSLENPLDNDGTTITIKFDPEKDTLSIIK